MDEESEDTPMVELEKQIKSLSLPLSTDVALANVLIYFRQSDQKPVVRHRNVHQNTWGREEIIWKAHSFFCWHDSHQHHGIPVVLPIAYDDRRERFAALGKFCSFSCAIKFQYARFGFFHTYIGMLCRLLAHKVYGYDIDTRFNAAPARESLKSFGNCGPVGMTIKQFRSVTHTTSFRKPPFFTPDRVHQNDEYNPIYSVILYQSWDAGYVVVSSFSNNLKSSTNFCCTSVCWYDTEPFTGDPVGIPISIIKKSQSSGYNNEDEDECLRSVNDNAKIYLVYGCFCSVECALAYLFEIRDWNNEVQLMQTHLMAKDYYDIHRIIEPAVPPWELTKFEGPMTIKEYRGLSTQNLQKSPTTKSELFWINTGIEYHSKNLPEGGYTTLRKQGIAVTEQLHSRTSDDDEKLLERPLYIQYLQMLEKRNAELRAEEDANEVGNRAHATKNSSAIAKDSNNDGQSSKNALGATSTTTSARIVPPSNATTITRSRNRKDGKDHSHALEVGSLMQYMRKTKPSQQQPKKR